MNSIKIKSPGLPQRDEQDRVLGLVVDTGVGEAGTGREGGPVLGPPTGHSHAVNSVSSANLTNAVNLTNCIPASSRNREIKQSVLNISVNPCNPLPIHQSSEVLPNQNLEVINSVQLGASSNNREVKPSVLNISVNPCVDSSTPSRILQSSETLPNPQNLEVINSRVQFGQFGVCTRVVIPSAGVCVTNVTSSKRSRKFVEILEGSNDKVKSINEKLLAMARAMTPAWSMRLLGVSCGSVVCAWGLLLVLSVLGGASHSTDLGGFGFDNAGTMEDLNGGRCPWACSCEGQELDCAERGLTQVPGDLTVLAEKL